MVSSNLKREAREKLYGKWGKAVLSTLIYTAIFFLLEFIGNLSQEASLQLFVSLFTIIIQVPLGFGLIVSYVRIFNDEDVKYLDLISSGFDNFGKSWCISLLTFVKMLLPIILLTLSIFLIIGTGIYSYASTANSTSIGLTFLSLVLLIVSIVWLITRSYSYQIAPIIAAVRPELSSKEVIDESKRVMKGNRWKLFCLQLSFIGWAILVAFTLGIGYLWLLPYIQFSTIAFYKFISNNNDIDTNSTNE